ncbi:glutathione S-transferase family protein [Pendulispora brunnea]|uniref:Glutathione S-transferase family protein n=1 Tax=Pendulispora brunnea TaxID=2905690 RepID=A0ABZ2JUP6_9BACT
MLTFYHAPQSRSFRALWALEELGIAYEMKLVNIRRADGSGGADETYRDVHPQLKVPAIVHDGETVIESSAICLYLSDAFPEAGLGPRVGEPGRAAFVSWLVFCAASLEPGLSGAFHKWQNMPMVLGSFEESLRYVERALSSRPYIAGDRFTAADIMVASALQFGMNVTKVIPSSPLLAEYLARCTTRPGFQRALAKDRG